MSDILTAIAEIESKKKNLVPIADPQEVFKGSIEIDEQLHRLAKNLKLLAELEYLAGQEMVRLEQIYNRKTMELARELTTDKLEEIGIVKSNKFKYINASLHQEEADVENMRLKYKYFKDIRNTYVEWCNIYKKTRTIAE